MSNTRLALYFGGTDMTWEDMAISLQLGVRNRHNFDDPNTKYLNYWFDGPAAAVSNQHKAVENLVFDKDQKDDFMQSSKRKMKNVVGYRFRWGTGKGTNHTCQAAYDMILDCILNRGVREIDLTGFSRGGSIALNLGALLKSLKKDLQGKLTENQINSISVNIFAIDPVAGKGRNKSASKYGPLSEFVKKCIIGLATNESLPGFHPRDSLSTTSRYQIQYGPNTEFIVLPFPDDHAMCVQWMRDIIRSQIPNNSELLSPCDEKRLIHRRLGWAETNWIDRIDETRAYRMIHYVKNKEKYFRQILTKDEKQNIEEFFKFIGTQQSRYNKGHISLQNDADTEEKDRTYENYPIGGLHPKTKSTQQSFAKKNQKKKYKRLGFHDRFCKEKLPQYTNSLFVNLLHEALFAKNYPALHQFFTTWNESHLASAITEFNAISAEQLPLTKAYIESALIQNISIKSLENFKSTNVKGMNEILKLALRTDVSTEEKKDDSKNNVSDAKEAKPEDSCMYQYLKFNFFKTPSEEKLESYTRVSLSSHN